MWIVRFAVHPLLFTGLTPASPTLFRFGRERSLGKSHHALAFCMHSSESTRTRDLS